MAYHQFVYAEDFFQCILKTYKSYSQTTVVTQNKNFNVRILKRNDSFFIESFHFQVKDFFSLPYVRHIFCDPESGTFESYTISNIYFGDSPGEH